MISLRAPANALGVSVISAAARAVVATEGGNGEAAALVLQMAAEDARQRATVGRAEAELELTTRIDGTEVVVILRDRGEPMSGPARMLAPLIDLGLLTSAEGSIDDGGNVTEMRFARPAHAEILDSGNLELVADDAALSDEPVSLRSLEVGDAAALTRAIYRCYGWTYPHPDLYYPERIAAGITSGRRIGEVAVTADGEIAAHWGALFLTPTIVESGLALTDPRFRRRGLAKELDQRVDARLVTSAATACVMNPVLTHTATQALVLEMGNVFVGTYLSYGMPVDQVGITSGVLRERRSLPLAYRTVKPLTPATVWVPSPYESFVHAVIDGTDWPRDFGMAQRAPKVATETVLATKLDSFNRRGEIEVRVLGQDLVDAVDAALLALRGSGAEVVHVFLPVNDPALPTLGEGLTELGLAFGAIIPEFTAQGDALVLQWLADPAVDTSTWHYINDEVEVFITSILRQVRDLSEHTMRSRRRAAHRAELFANLDP
ncbi:MAG: hypothetical protein WCI29_13620 [Actinomycetes bacterium]